MYGKMEREWWPGKNCYYGIGKEREFDTLFEMTVNFHLRKAFVWENSKVRSRWNDEKLTQIEELRCLCSQGKLGLVRWNEGKLAQVVGSMGKN